MAMDSNDRGPAGRSPLARLMLFVAGVAAGALLLALIAVLLLAATQGEGGTAVARLFAKPTSSPVPTVVPATATPTMTASSTPTHTSTPSPTATPTSTPTPTPIVAIRQVNALGRYETLQFVMQTVVDLERTPDTLWERLCGTDKLLLIAGGEAIAGFDLNKVRPEDLIVVEKSVALTLPPTEILSYFVKEDETSVYFRETGLLCRPDPQLETDARRQAEGALLDWALSEGILERAEEAGLLQLERLLAALGFTEITLRVRMGPPGD